MKFLAVCTHRINTSKAMVPEAGCNHSKSLPTQIDDTRENSKFFTRLKRLQSKHGILLDVELDENLIPYLFYKMNTVSKTSR